MNKIKIGNMIKPKRSQIAQEKSVGLILAVLVAVVVLIFLGVYFFANYLLPWIKNTGPGSSGMGKCSDCVSSSDSNCYRDDCWQIQNCYFKAAIVAGGSCYNCADVKASDKCSVYADRDECENDACKFKNCVWTGEDTGACGKASK